MKSISTAAKSLSELLTDRKFTIQYYQREYMWTDDQVDALLDDLKGEFDRCCTNQSHASIDEYDCYFLGSVLLASGEDDTSSAIASRGAAVGSCTTAASGGCTASTAVNAIIDGQQRLTTLTLLLISLQKQLISFGGHEDLHIERMLYSGSIDNPSLNISVATTSYGMNGLEAQAQSASSSSSSSSNQFAALNGIDGVAEGADRTAISSFSERADEVGVCNTDNQASRDVFIIKLLQRVLGYSNGMVQIELERMAKENHACKNLLNSFNILDDFTKVKSSSTYDSCTSAVRSEACEYDGVYDEDDASHEDGQAQEYVFKSRDELVLFTQWLLHKVIFAEISTPTLRDANRLFATINDRGLQLTPIEMLKGFILSDIKDEGKRAEADIIWKAAINQLKNIKTKKKGKAPEYFICSFLRAQFACEYPDYIAIGQSYRTWINENIDNILHVIWVRLTYDDNSLRGIERSESSAATCSASPVVDTSTASCGVSSGADTSTGSYGASNPHVGMDKQLCFIKFVELFAAYAHIYKYIADAESKYSQELEYVFFNGAFNAPLRRQFLLAAVGFSFDKHGKVFLEDRPLSFDKNGNVVFKSSPSASITNEKLNLAARFLDLFIIYRIVYEGFTYSSKKIGEPLLRVSLSMRSTHPCNASLARHSDASRAPSSNSDGTQNGDAGGDQHCSSSKGLGCSDARASHDCMPNTKCSNESVQTRGYDHSSHLQLDSTSALTGNKDSVALLKSVLLRGLIEITGHTQDKNDKDESYEAVRLLSRDLWQATAVKAKLLSYGKNDKNVKHVLARITAFIDADIEKYSCNNDDGSTVDDGTQGRSSTASTAVLKYKHFVRGAKKQAYDIEHVIPKGSKGYRKDILNNIGNLVLLPQGLNRGVITGEGNNSFNNKLEFYFSDVNMVTEVANNKKTTGAVNGNYWAASLHPDAYTKTALRGFVQRYGLGQETSDNDSTHEGMHAAASTVAEPIVTPTDSGWTAVLDECASVTGGDYKHAVLNPKTENGYPTHKLALMHGYRNAEKDIACSDLGQDRDESVESPGELIKPFDSEAIKERGELLSKLFSLVWNTKMFEK